MLLFFVLDTHVASAAQQRFVLVADSSRVEYSIAHTIARVTGAAGTPSGELGVALDSLPPIRDGIVRVDLRELQTGIRRRDEHIRSAEYLDVTHHPMSEFVLGSLFTSRRGGGAASGEPPARGAIGRDLRPGAGGEATPPVRWSGVAFGSLTLHGVTRQMQIPVVVRWDVSGAMRIHAEFEIALADFAIKRPRKLFFRTGETVDVRLELLFRPQQPEAP